MNITVYLGAFEGNDPALADEVKNLEHGLARADIPLYTVVLSQDLWG